MMKNVKTPHPRLVLSPAEGATQAPARGIKFPINFMIRNICRNVAVGLATVALLMSGGTLQAADPFSLDLVSKAPDFSTTAQSKLK